MGVDIMTYRASIGTFKHTFGCDVVVQDVMVDLSLIRQITTSVMMCVMVLIVVLFELNLITGAQHSIRLDESKDIPHGTIWENNNLKVVDSLLHLSVIDIMEFIGYCKLLTAVSLDLKTSGKPYYTRREENDVQVSNVNIFYCLRHTLNPDTLSHVCIGSVSFIGILLLMAGVESNPGPTGGHEEDRRTEEDDLIKRLQLSEFFPGKINIFDVLSVNQQRFQDLSGRKEHDLPWILLSRLIFVDDSAFCLDNTGEVMTTESEEYYDTSSDEEDGSEEYTERESNQLNYLDVFLLAFQCCSLMMKQRLIQKMFLCRFAVPFLISSRHNSKHTLSKWPMRSLIVETCFNETGTRECSVLELKSKCVAFGRIGRPPLSKSQLLNRIISDNNSKTFFNRSCQSGNVSKTLCLGYIETFWLPHTGNGEDVFDDALMFMNMRGCLKRDFSEEVKHFLSRIADNITIFIGKKDFSECQRELATVVSLFKSVVIIIVGHSKVKLKTLVSDLSGKENCNVRFIETYNRKNKQEKHDDEITKEIVQHLKEQMKNTDPLSLENRLKSCELNGIEIDEQLETCAYGHQLASKFCETINCENDFLSLKKRVTPIQSTVGSNLGSIFKQLKRSTDYEVQEEKRAELSKVRKTSLTIITKPIRDFMEVLNASKSVEEIDYFITWVDIFLSRKSRVEIFELKLQQQDAWKKFHKRKQELPNREYDEKDDIKILESKIDAASFSVMHIFREIGLIYDTVCELKQDTYKLRLPDVDSIASILAKLVARGRQFELIDGDNFYLAHNWLTKVLSSVDTEIYYSKVLTMSVLGVQSSGKSTLLNAMFGAMFPTSAGRCTRGIHAQLVPYQDESDASAAHFEHKYILVLDTEGLCPTEIVRKDHEHDNELATLITGLGDVTIVNVMGENTQEIRDILQIVVHAFLRLKITNKELELNKKCLLVQQNISSMSAESHLNEGLNKLIAHLDEMTLDSARYEGIENISTFDQVIEFDGSTDVRYLSNVWDGDPPLARINRSYSQKIDKIKMDVAKRTFHLTFPSSNNLGSFVSQTYDLWQGVLNESFVFSFKNSLERKAYLGMDAFIQNKLWEIENIITDQIHLIKQEEFCKCQTQEVINKSNEEVDKRINGVIDNEKQKAEKLLNNYFVTCDDKIIAIQWKENQVLRVRRFFDKIALIVKDTVEQEKATCIKNLILSDRRKVFRECLLKDAQAQQKEFMDSQQITNFFEQHWKDSFGASCNDSAYEVGIYDLKKAFEDCLFEMHIGKDTELKHILEQVNWYGSPKRDLQNALNFQLTGFHDEIDAESDTQVDVALQDIEPLYLDIAWKIKLMCRMNERITISHVHDLLKFVKKVLTNRNLEFKPRSFYMKIYVHVSIFAQHKFHEHNNKPIQKLNTELMSYKQQQKLLFEEYLELRKTEDTVVEIITSAIDRCIKDKLTDKVSSEIQNFLRRVLPKTKIELITELCTDLINTRNFSKIDSYLQNPLETAQKWLDEKANICLFHGSPNQYTLYLRATVDALYLKVAKSLEPLQNTNDNTVPISNLFNRIRLNLSANEILISYTDFESMFGCRKDSKVNLGAVCEAVKNKVCALTATILDSGSLHTTENVSWQHGDPVQRHFEHIWGCSELCPFCKEPCEKSDLFHTECHTCIQHRPLCLRGVRAMSDEQACLNTCNYYVQSKHSTFSCRAINYVCNDGMSECSTQNQHKYTNYRKTLKNWFIQPNSDMHQSSTFWLWVAATFKDQFAQKYKFKTDEIPRSWGSISAEDAEESLRNSYR